MIDDVRAQAAREWALDRIAALLPAGCGLAEARFAPASADASFRRYFRVEIEIPSDADIGDVADPRPTSQGNPDPRTVSASVRKVDRTRRWIVMDAPPEHEDCRPFVRIAGLFREAGLEVPTILAQDLVRGFLLLEDLGEQTYLGVIDAENADALFSAAIDAMVRLQRGTQPGSLPPYDRALLARELALFPDWYVRHEVGRALTASEQADWDATCAVLIDSALAQPRVWVHRDWMPRNLMPPLPGRVGPGVLDFQDAVEGPLTYDVVCLFRDAFVSWPDTRVYGWLAQWRAKALAAGLPVPVDAARLRRDFDLMGAQRHLKVIGIFARICHRDGKPKYLADVPRFFAYLRGVCTTHAELAPLSRLLDSLGIEAGDQ